jgi:hypothetical protein
MAAPQVLSDEQLFQLTGSWQDAAALRDAQNAALNEYNWSQQGAPAQTVAPTGGLLSGNIMAGASWNSTNTALQDALTEATGQQTSNYAIAGSTTTDTLNQLNNYLAGGGRFDPNATVYLQAGGVDFIQGVDKAVVKDNLNQIVKTLGNQGVNVVLTGSPYAASVQDVINNNFDPKVDQIYNDVAKANSNVALVGTQGEILQNKKLLVDALHTNAEGTAVYNQSVIDALSQFKNDVPPSTPEYISQVQDTNSIATTPISKTITDYRGVEYDKNTLIKLAQQIAPTLDKNNLAGGVYNTTNGNIGFAYDEATNALGYKPTAAEQVVLDMARHLIDTGVTDINQVDVGNQNQRFGSTYTGEGGTIYEIKRDEATGNIVTSTWGRTTSDKGNIIAALSIGAGLLGLPTQLGTAILGAGASPVAASALGGALLGGTTAGLTGNDILKGALLGGAGGYVGGQLNNYLNYQDVPVDFNNMTPDQINDALDINFRNDLARTGMSDAQIKSFLANPASIYDATQAVTQPVAFSTPVTDGGAVNITAQNTPSLNNVLSTIGTTLPAVNVTAPKTQVDQSTLNLINSQLASNVGKSTNLANVEITGAKPATAQDIVTALTSSLPISNAQAQYVAEQVITSGKPVTTQDVISAISSTLPILTTPTTSTTIPTTTITAQKPIAVGDTLAAITTIPSTLTTTPTTPTKETDPLKVAQLALAAAGLLGAGKALSNTSTPTGFDVVPIPASFGNPPAPKVAPYTPLAPINFGNRNLLIGTQWEKFLDPNYGQVPAPVQYSQPSNLSYNDLMGILGSRQGMPSRSNLSINDVISGIQNQYGQAPTGTMG